MPDVITLPYKNLSNAIHDMLSAHEAIKDGIATHAQKEQVERDGARQAATARRKLITGMTGNGK